MSKSYLFDGRSLGALLLSGGLAGGLLFLAGVAVGFHWSGAQMAAANAAPQTQRLSSSAKPNHPVATKPALPDPNPSSGPQVLARRRIPGSALLPNSPPPVIRKAQYGASRTRGFVARAERVTGVELSEDAASPEAEESGAPTLEGPGSEVPGAGGPSAEGPSAGGPSAERPNAEEVLAQTLGSPESGSGEDAAAPAEGPQGKVASQEPSPEVRPEFALPPLPPPPPAFSLQVGAFLQPENLERFLADLSERGYTPRVLEITSSSGRVLSIVRVGGFSERSQATQAALTFQKREGMDAFVRPEARG